MRNLIGRGGGGSAAVAQGLITSTAGAKTEAPDPSQSHCSRTSPCERTERLPPPLLSFPGCGALSSQSKLLCPLLAEPLQDPKFSRTHSIMLPLTPARYCPKLEPWDLLAYLDCNPTHPYPSNQAGARQPGPVGYFGACVVSEPRERLQSMIGEGWRKHTAERSP